MKSFVAFLCERIVARRAILLLLGVSCGIWCVPTAVRAEVSHSGTLTLEILMQHFSTTHGVRAEFEERKQMALLQQPVVSRGILYFVPPARMARYVREPLASSLIIENDKLSFQDDLGREELSLAERPEARELVSHFLVLFQGDLPALRKKYDVGFEAQAAAWTLTLRPRTFPAKSLIESVQMTGNDRALLKMAVLETDGDRTDTVFSKVEVDRVFPAEELAKIFTAAPARTSQKADDGKP